MTFFLNLVLGVAFVIVIESLFLFAIKPRTIEPLLHFDLRLVSLKRLCLLLLALICTFSKILKCLLERFYCWRKLKKHIKWPFCYSEFCWRVFVSKVDIWQHFIWFSEKIYMAQLFFYFCRQSKMENLENNRTKIQLRQYKWFKKSYSCFLAVFLTKFFLV